MPVAERPCLRTRLAKGFRWGGVVVCGLLLALYVMNLWWGVGASSGAGFWIGAYRGDIRMIGVRDASPPEYMKTMYCKVEADRGAFGWWPQFQEFGGPSAAYPQFPGGPPKSAMPPGAVTTRWLLDVPLWMPLVAVGFATGVMWMGEGIRRMRAASGHQSPRP